MLIILPYHHDRMEAQRLPVITIGIIAINVVIHIFSHFLGTASQKETFQQERKLVEYYLFQPKLELPESVLRQLSPGSRQAIAEARRYTAILDLQISPRPEDQEQFNQLISRFEAALKNDYYRKYGHIPSRGGFVTLFTSMFLHGGILHLLTNMLFLWLSGCSMEDLWGRVLYPIFYLLGGIVATQTHALIFPQSNIPLIGASGAIAAVMGAFIIRLYKSRIRFFYLAFFFIRIFRGKFEVPAYIIGPLWLIEQLWWALLNTGEEAGGVAFWAHIGGFVFGALVALFIRFTGLEKRVIAPALESKAELMDQHLSTGIEQMEAGDHPGAIYHFRKTLLVHSDDALARGQLCRAYLKTQRQELARLEFKRTLELHLSQDHPDLAAQEYLELTALDKTLLPEARVLMKIARTLEDQEAFLEAANAYQRVFTIKETSPDKPSNAQRIIALLRYAALCTNHLETPEKALAVYKRLLKYKRALLPEQLEEIRLNAPKAKALYTQQSDSASQSQKASSQASPESEAPSPKTLEERVRIVDPLEKEGPYTLTTVTHIKCNKILPAEKGLDLQRPLDGPLDFDRISAMCVFRLLKGDDSDLLADMFVAGKSRPYRLSSLQVAYPYFFEDVQPTNLENFHRFIWHVVLSLDSVHMDPGSLSFLKTQKPQEFDGRVNLELHEKRIWQQLIYKAKIPCSHCTAINWIDEKLVITVQHPIPCFACKEPLDTRRVSDLTPG